MAAVVNLYEVSAVGVLGVGPFTVTAGADIADAVSTTLVTTTAPLVNLYEASAQATTVNQIPKPDPVVRLYEASMRYLTTSPGVSPFVRLYEASTRNYATVALNVFQTLTDTVGVVDEQDPFLLTDEEDAPSATAGISDSVSYTLTPTTGGGGDPYVPPTSNDYLIEIGFGFTVSDTAIDWTDVTSYVLDDPGITIKRGRSSERDRPTPGRASFRLKNGDRRFDPNHATGPYYGNLVPRVPVRVSALIDGAPFQLFRGYIPDGFPQSYSETYSTVDIECVDALGFLADVDAQDSLWAYTTEASNPKAWWRFDNFDVSEVIEQTTGNPTQLYGRFADFGRSLIAGNKANASSGPIGSTYVEHWQTEFMLSDWQTVTGSTNSLEVWFATSTETTPTPALASDLLVYGQYDRRGQPTFAVWVTTTGLIRIIVDNGATRYTAYWTNRSTVQTETVGSISPFGTMHLVVVPNGTNAANWQVWLNGNRLNLLSGQPFTASAAATTGPSWRALIGVGGDQPTVDLVLDECVVYDYALSADDVTSRWVDGLTGGANTSLSTRFNQIVDIAGWAAVGTVDESGMYDSSVFDGSSRSALEQVQLLDAAEQGLVFADRAGQLTYRNRSYWWDDPLATTSQATFADDGTEISYQAKDLKVAFDDARIVNHAEVSRRNGATQTSRDASSIDRYGVKSYSLDGLPMSSDYQARSLADWFTYAFHDPVERIDQLSFVVQRDAGTYSPVAAALDLGQLVTVNRTPQSVGAQSTFQTHVYGITHQISSTVWRTTLDLSAARSGFSWFTWGSGTWGGPDGWSF